MINNCSVTVNFGKLVKYKLIQPIKKPPEGGFLTNVNLLFAQFLNNPQLSNGLGQLRRRFVTLGEMVADDRIEVLSGLAVGEAVLLPPATAE